ncbi:MAG: DUF6132 family protein [Ignavibacteria bacterium]|nr:DUF6132 family protein [Ignavibacteria bacterium]
MNVWLKRGLFVLAGAGGGFLYYYYIGCLGGTCPITSNPFLSSGYGAMIGVILGLNNGKKSAS